MQTRELLLKKKFGGPINNSPTQGGEYENKIPDQIVEKTRPEQLADKTWSEKVKPIMKVV